MERWKIVERAPAYEVSDFGRVRRVETGLVLRPALDPSGYPQVNLSVRGKTRITRIHRLVAVAFVPIPLGCSVVNHKDSDKANNRAANLEWTTARGNAWHAGAAGKLAQKLNSTQVLDIRARLSQGEPVAKLAGQFGVSDVMIRLIRSRKCWAYVENEE